MGENARSFKEYVERENWGFNIADDEYGMTHAISDPKRLRNGGMVRFHIIFDKEDINISIEARQFINGVNVNNREKMLELTNELNDKYLFLKFVILEDDIKIVLVKRSVEEEIRPEHIINSMVSIGSVIEEEYEKFMKAMWA